MENIIKLEKLLKTDIMVEVENDIEELTELVEKHKKKEDKDELQYILDVKKYFVEVLSAIDNKTLNSEQADEILEFLEGLKIKS